MNIIKSLWTNAHILLLLTTLMWAGHAIVLKLSINEISPFLLTTLRWFGCTLFLFFLIRKNLKKDFYFLNKNFLWLFIMGSIFLSGFTICLIIGAYNTSAINMGINQSFIPAIVVLFGWIVFKKKINAIQVFGLILSVFGVILLTIKGSLLNIRGMDLNFGDLIMLLGCCFYAFYTLGLSQNKTVSPLVLFFFFSVFASISMIFFLIFEVISGNLILPNFKSFMILIYIIIFPTVLAQIFFIKGVNLLGANLAGLYVNLVPIFTALLAIIILDENVYSFHFISLFLVLLGIYLSQKFEKNIKK